VEKKEVLRKSMSMTPGEKTPELRHVLQRMERMIGGVGKGRKGHEAQQLVYDAWEAADSEEALELLLQAVELDPTNVDAWLGLMDFEPLKGHEEIELLRHLVTLGEKNLGKKVFKNDKGLFWGILETRPYMRARSQLALRLMEAGRLEESIVEHEGMLELNPNDNQGVRYGLLALYLATDNLEGSSRLFRQYDEREFSAVWAWGYVLERYLSGDLEGATGALSQAQKQNRYAQAYFLEHRKPPKLLPAMYSPGSREEAIIAWDILKHAWKQHPEAQAWLHAIF
jgi:tetratricopeptide (TPR) repeat protein